MLEGVVGEISKPAEDRSLGDLLLLLDTLRAEVIDKILEIRAPLRLNCELSNGVSQTWIEMLDDVGSLILSETTQEGVMVSP